MKKRLGSLLLSLALICSLLLALPVQAMAEEPRVVAARDSVVRIAVRIGISYGNRQFFATGSGFLVGEEGKDPQYVITNRHVVDGEQILAEIAAENSEYRYSSLEGIDVWVLIDGKTYEVSYSSGVILSQIADLAILKLNEPAASRTPAVLGSTDGLKVTDTVYALGFPGSADVEDYNNDILDSSIEDKLAKLFTSGVDNVSVTRGNVVKNNVVTSGISHIQHDADLSYGSSGGPLVTADGSVVGINAWSNSEGAALAFYAIEVSHLKTFLNQNKIPYREPSEAPAATPEPTAEPQPGPEPKSDSKLWPAVGIGAAALVVAVLAVILSRRKKKKKKSAYPEGLGKTVPAKQQRPLVPILRSLSPQHGGQKVALGRDAVLIGRSRDCRILFSEDTPGVSGRHCAVTWDADAREFIVKDMGSTYGTFLDSGMKLEPNRLYRLKPGESFYLGEKTNTIRLEVE